MQSFFIGISNFIYGIWDIIKNIIDYFLGLFETLGQYVTFVMSMMNTLPSIVRAPAYIILTVMIIKFFLNLGKN